MQIIVKLYVKLVVIETTAVAMQAEKFKAIHLVDVKTDQNIAFNG